MILPNRSSVPDTDHISSTKGKNSNWSSPITRARSAILHYHWSSTQIDQLLGDWTVEVSSCDKWKILNVASLSDGDEYYYIIAKNLQDIILNILWEPKLLYQRTKIKTKDSCSLTLRLIM
jgi:hypothetical protein